MSAKVDLSSIFDNALPMAYVRKVTLSKGSVISNKREPNQLKIYMAKKLWLPSLIFPKELRAQVHST